MMCRTVRYAQENSASQELLEALLESQVASLMFKMQTTGSSSQIICKAFWVNRAYCRVHEVIMLLTFIRPSFLLEQSSMEYICTVDFDSVQH